MERNEDVDRPVAAGDLGGKPSGDAIGLEPVVGVQALHQRLADLADELELTRRAGLGLVPRLVGWVVADLDQDVRFCHFRLRKGR
jgi:hypothetical protein